MSKTANDPHYAELAGRCARVLGEIMPAVVDDADITPALLRKMKREFRTLRDYIGQTKLAEVRADPNDRLISLTETAKMLHRSTRTLRQQYRDEGRARFPFIFRDGARLVGSEAGILDSMLRGEAW